MKGREAPGYAKAQLDQQIAQQQADIGKKAFKSQEALRAQGRMQRIMGQKSSVKQAADEAAADRMARKTNAAEARKKAAIAAANDCQGIVEDFEDNILKKSSWGAATIKQGKYCDHIGNCKANKERFESSAWGSYYNPLLSGCGKLEGDFKKLRNLHNEATAEDAPPAQGGAGGRKSRRRRRKSRRRKATRKRSGANSQDRGAQIRAQIRAQIGAQSAETEAHGEKGVECFRE